MFYFWKDRIKWQIAFSWISEIYYLHQAGFCRFITSLTKLCHVVLADLLLLILFVNLREQIKMTMKMAAPVSGVFWLQFCATCRPSLLNSLWWLHTYLSFMQTVAAAHTQSVLGITKLRSSTSFSEQLTHSHTIIYINKYTVPVYTHLPFVLYVCVAHCQSSEESPSAVKGETWLNPMLHTIQGQISLSLHSVSAGLCNTHVTQPNSQCNYTCLKSEKFCFWAKRFAAHFLMWLYQGRCSRTVYELIQSRNSDSVFSKRS